MKTYTEAITIISKAVKRLDFKQIALEDASNYILAENIISPIDVAPYRNSAMDGFAVAYKDVKPIPFTFSVKAVLYAGDSESYTYEKKTALKIMTGAPIPEGYDTVIPVEDTTFDKSNVTFNEQISKYQNVRLSGEDIQTGDLIYKSGQTINPLHIGVLASMGLTKIPVFRKPNVLILSTGNELVEPGNTLKFGQSYNSNSFTLRSILAPFCQSIAVDSILLDEPEGVSKALSQKYDVIITSGGVSVGDKDLIPIMAERCDWIKKLHKVAVKPGKPLFFAQKDNQYLFGLPGNPLSTAVSCACFVIPAIKKMIGVKNYMPQKSQVELSKDSIIKSGRSIIWPGKIYSEKGKLFASFSPKKSSAALSALLNTDGLIFQYKADDEPSGIEFTSWQQILNI